MKNLQIEMASFLSHNNQTNYFHYLHKGNGMDQNRNEYILDMLLYSVLKSYAVFNGKENKVVQIINAIMKQEMFWNETIAMLKMRLFMVDLETYNQAINIINTNIDDADFLTLLEKEDYVPNNLKWIVYYLMEEMETLSDISERKRVAC